MTFSLYVVFALISFTEAQKQDPKYPAFGEIDLTKLGRTHYSKDSTAKGVILNELQFVEFGVNLKQIRRVHVQLQLLAGATEWPEIQIPFEQNVDDRQFITEKKAQILTRNADKTVTTLQVSENAFSVRTLARGFSTITLKPQNAAAGSILEYLVVMESASQQPLRRFTMGGPLPVEKSSLVVRIPDYFRYEVLIPGTSRFDDQKVVEDQEYFRLVNGANRLELMLPLKENKWTRYNIPAISTEPDGPELSAQQTVFSFNMKDFGVDQQIQNKLIVWWDKSAPQIEKFGLSSTVQNNPETWATVVPEYVKSTLIKSRYEYDSKLGKLFSQIPRNTDRFAEAASVLEEIKSQFLWDSTYYHLPLKTSANLYALRRGNGADLNLMFLSELKKRGFNVSPVWISRNNPNAVDPNLAYPSQFDHILALVTINNRNIFVDASEKFTPFGERPVSLATPVGLRFEPSGKFEWMEMPAHQMDQLFIQLDGTLSKSGELTMNGTATTTAGAIARLNQKIDEAEFTGDSKHHPLWISGYEASVSIQSMEKVAESTRRTYTIQEKFSPKSDSVSFAPAFFSALVMQDFQIPNRRSPVVFSSPRTVGIRLALALPEEAVVSRLPVDEIIRFGQDADATFSYDDDSGMTVSVTLNIRKTSFSTEEIPRFWAFLDLVKQKAAKTVSIRFQ